MIKFATAIRVGTASAEAILRRFTRNATHPYTRLRRRPGEGRRRGATPYPASVQFEEAVETRGHLLDSGVLARVLDDVLEYGGDYRIDRLDLGREHEDESYARLTLGAPDEDLLQRLLMRVQVHGVNQVDPGVVMTRPAPRDGVFPDDFYSTTNLETFVRLDAGWLPVQRPEMDCGLRVVDGVIETVPVSDVGAGDLIVCGASGVRVSLPALVEDGRDSFGFMSSAVSSEKPQALLVRQIAQQMRAVRASGLKVLWVGGPAVVHTGAAPAIGVGSPFATAAAGVPVGTNKPCQPFASKPFKPDSSKVGTSGNAARRTFLVTAIALNLPALTYGMVTDVASMIRSI